MLQSDSLPDTLEHLRIACFHAETYRVAPGGRHRRKYFRVNCIDAGKSAPTEFKASLIYPLADFQNSFFIGSE